MSDTFAVHPPAPRWTHIALPANDIDEAIAWYEEFTPLELLDRREDADGWGAWMGHPDSPDKPFILVLVTFRDAQGKGKQPQLHPFAHIGIELTSREEVDEIAAKGKAAGCLYMEPTEMPAPIGYICALTDPDDNVIEYSYDQGVYAIAQEKWGSA